MQLQNMLNSLICQLVAFKHIIEKKNCEQNLHHMPDTVRMEIICFDDHYEIMISQSKQQYN